MPPGLLLEVPLRDPAIDEQHHEHEQLLELRSAALLPLQQQRLALSPVEVAVLALREQRVPDDRLHQSAAGKGPEGEPVHHQVQPNYLLITTTLNRKQMNTLNNFY